MFKSGVETYMTAIVKLFVVTCEVYKGMNVLKIEHIYISFYGLLQISVRSEISLLIGELSNSPQFVTASSFHLSSSLIFIPALISIPHFLPHHSDYVDQPTLRLSNWDLRTKSVRKFQKFSWYSLIYWVILSSLKG